MGEADLTLAFVIACVAALYSTVGHAGASGYLAILALAGAAPGTMKPTALVLNILVATIATVNFRRAGVFYWSAIWPFALGSVPLAALGGAVQLPGRAYQVLVGLLLLVAASRLAWGLRPSAAPPEVLAPRIPLLPAIGIGAAIGVLSGLTGTGGGIFLSPLLVFFRWADVRRTAGISACFILLNSIAGLAGRLTAPGELPAALPLWAFAAMAGGFVGSSLGARRLPQRALQGLLAGVLVIAAAKLVLS